MEVEGKQVWRPLGHLLAAQGVVAVEEIEEALVEQERTGERLGEILISLGYASRVSIIDALAQQAGLLLEPEHGFGSGLREQIERRHRDNRDGSHTDDAEIAKRSDLTETLLEQVREQADPPATDPNPSRSEPESDFLAVVARAEEYLAARRGALPQPTAAH